MQRNYIYYDKNLNKKIKKVNTYRVKIGGSILRRIGIYFFCVVALGCVTSSILYRESEKAKEIRFEKQAHEERTLESEQESDVTEETKIIEVSGEQTPEERFLVIEEYGYLVIYDRLTMKQYDETTIRLSDLPKELQTAVMEGLYFMNEEALYAFLESYSS